MSHLPFASLAALTAAIHLSVLCRGSSRQQVIDACTMAREWQFRSVRVETAWVPVAAGILSGTRVRAGVAISFPEGTLSPPWKVDRVRVAIDDGATAIAWVLNSRVANDPAAWEGMGPSLDEAQTLGRLMRAYPGMTWTATMECCELDDQAKDRLAHCLWQHCPGIAIGTSTGFGQLRPGEGTLLNGATVPDVRLLRSIGACTPRTVEASGGIQSLSSLVALYRAGANSIVVDARHISTIMDQAREQGLR